VKKTPSKKTDSESKDLGGAGHQVEEGEEKTEATKRVDISFSVVDPSEAKIYTDSKGRLVYTYKANSYSTT
jgi:hypothetical protein